MTPFHLACQNNTFIFKEIFFNYLIDINLSNEDQLTPLMFACQNGMEEIVKILITNPNLNINLKHKFGL